ncbi:MAG: DUF4397 domain-containing protein [Clostridiales bacterium]|nr:DUF4397 domain-containing protein [Clostridiales bacterium]
MEMDDGSMPMIPSPNPIEMEPVSPDFPDEEMPLSPDYTEEAPISPNFPNEETPLPSNLPTENIPAFPGFPGQSTPSSRRFPGNAVITVIPRPIVPCFFCNSNTIGQVRFLNTAVGYGPFRIAINNRTILSSLSYAEISQYGRVSSGYQTITVSGQNGYVYLSQQMLIDANAKHTIAIVNTADGSLDLALITDRVCAAPGNLSCLRACNLSYNSGPLNILLSNGYVVFRNVNFMDFTSYRRLLSGNYLFFVSRGGRVLVTSPINVRANSQYTIYIFNWNTSPGALRTLVVEDRNE